MVKVSSWGRLTADEHDVQALSRQQLKRSAPLSQHDKGLTYGMGRSYGDVCLNPGKTLWRTEHLDRFIQFNSATGQLTCEAGVLLGDIQQAMIPQGWMLPVTPGTQFVTVGGAIANDIHGKNHHRFGSFGNQVLHFDLLRTDGQIIQCSPHKNADWFAATLGGMGLTGIITKACLQLRSVPGPWLNSETIPYANLSEFFDLADSSEHDWEYTVSWIDCYNKNKNRGLFMRANHMQHTANSAPKKKLTIPFSLPISMINRLSLPVFNSFYYTIKTRQLGAKPIHYENFLYPLDHILQWNRIYGRKGFFQYQCVVPRTDGKESITALLQIIAHSKQGSFLSVLKTFGNYPALGMMSFPQPGVTLALDFPNKNADTLKLFNRLDSIVKEAQGRVYMAKDACMSKELFIQGYPNLTKFLQYRDPNISSALAHRLMENM
jgi:FAD/FMN-containing dehydrogenase